MNISSPGDRKKQTQSAIITNEDRWAATKEPETKFQGQNKKKTDAKCNERVSVYQLFIYLFIN
jgi:hypothetical protein